MADVIELQSSRESEIDRQLDELSAKIVRREADRGDLVKYQELLAARTRLMRPKFRIKIPGAARRRYA